MTLAARIQQAGFILEVEEGNLYVEPFSKLTDRQRAFLKRHKAEIIAELTATANGDGDRLAFRYCPICGDDTLHQRLDGQWRCTRRHPPWPRFSDSDRTGPWVECWTPAGGSILIRARDQEHAEWLRKMNPPPSDSATKSNGEDR